MHQSIYHSLTLFILVAALVAAPLTGGEQPHAMVDIWKDQARLEWEDTLLEISKAPSRFTLSYRGKVRFRSTPANFITSQSGETARQWDAISGFKRRFNGILVNFRSKSGSMDRLLITMEDPRHLRWEILPGNRDVDSIKVRVRQESDEHYYGLGDLWFTEHVDAKGAVVDLWMEEDSVGKPDESAYIPYFMSTSGYGMFIDSSYPGILDFGSNNPEVSTFDFPSPGLTMHIWLGETFKELLPQYLDLTGYPPLPPEWLFEPHKWRDEGTWEEVFRDVRMMEERNIPLGVIWLDRPWALGEYGSDDYFFDTERYPEPEKHLQILEDKGIEVIVWGSPLVTEDSLYFQEGREKGYFIGGYGAPKPYPGPPRHMVDFANPEAREWFKDIIKNVLDKNIDGIKLDRGTRYPEDVISPSGRDPIEMHNYYPYLMVRTFAEALQESGNGEMQLLPKAVWSGNQPWSIKWPGDMLATYHVDRGFPAVVRAQSAVSLTGFPITGSDIGGRYTSQSKGKFTKELFIRWLQYGTFNPLMQTDGKGKYEDLPFSFDDETWQIYRYYAHLRMNLIPYIMEQAELAHKKGTPIIRHLVWDWPEDPEVHTRDYEFLFGPDLLVAPVVTPSNQREIYLPEGVWVDFWDRDREFEGPIFKTFEVPLEQIPVFIRKGSDYEFDLPDIPIVEE